MVGGDDPLLAGRRVGDDEVEQPGLLGQHHSPRQVVALLGEAHVAGLDQVAQRQASWTTASATSTARTGRLTSAVRPR